MASESINGKVGRGALVAPGTLLVALFIGTVANLLPASLLIGAIAACGGLVMAVWLLRTERAASPAICSGLIILLIAVSAVQDLVSHLGHGEVFRFARDTIVALLIACSIALSARYWIRSTIDSKGLALSFTLIGIAAVLLSDNRLLGLWAFRDGYLYALLPIVGASVGSARVLRGVALAIIVCAFANICIGTLQQLGPPDLWYEMGYYEIASVEKFGLRRPWGTFDRSLTYGHFLLIAAVLARFVLGSTALGVLFLLFAALALNRSVLVGVVIVFLYFLRRAGRLSNRFLLLGLGALAAAVLGEYFWSVASSMWDLGFASNVDRLLDYAAILNLPLSELVTGGKLGLVGSTAGRFDLEAAFTVGVAHIHNGYLTILLEVGVLGLAFLGLSVGFWARRVTAHGKSGREVLLPLVWVFALSMLTHNMQTNIPNNLIFWILLGVLSTAWRNIPRPEADGA
jgi:hypothetical protein